MTAWARRIGLWGPVVIYMAAIFYVSSLSHAPLPPGVGDKPAHSVGYLGLAIVVVRALAGGLPARIRWVTVVAALMICVGYGASDEFHQSFVPGRSAEVADLYADTIGATIGTALCWAWGIIAPTLGHQGPRHDV